MNSTTTTTSSLLTINEAAALLRVKPSTLRTWSRQGRVPVVRFGRLVRFDRDELLVWIESCKQAAKAS